jgi:DNA-binding Lrp family transcriptional regulator
MITAYVFVQFGLGDPVAVLSTIREIPGVKQAHAVMGPIDVIVYVEVADLKTLAETIVAIRAVDGVTGNDTRLAWPI